jgi:DNA-directed RNA polymerase specialized sigma24 family protein
MEYGPELLEELCAREADPKLAVELAEECDRLLAALEDAELQRVALLRVDGYSVEAIAEEISCAPRSVKRKLKLIRSIWGREADRDAG